MKQFNVFLNDELDQNKYVCGTILKLINEKSNLLLISRLCEVFD